MLSIPSAEQNYLAFNTGNSANPLLKNPALWEAARWLVDYDGITKDLLKGQYFVHQSFLPVGLPGALDNNPFKFDPAKAKAILAKAGIKDAHFTLDVENKPPFITVAGLNGWQIPQLNKETQAAVAEADPAKRLDLYKKMQEELQRSSPYVFVDQGKTQIVVRDNVKGYQQGLNADMVWYDNVTK